MTAEQYPINPIEIRANEAAYEAGHFILMLFVSRAAGTEVMDEDEEGTCVVPVTEASIKANKEAMQHALDRLRLAREDCAAREVYIELPQDS